MPGRATETLGAGGEAAAVVGGGNLLCPWPSSLLLCVSRPTPPPLRLLILPPTIARRCRSSFRHDGMSRVVPRRGRTAGGGAARSSSSNENRLPPSTLKSCVLCCPVSGITTGAPPKVIKLARQRALLCRAALELTGCGVPNWALFWCYGCSEQHMRVIPRALK